MQAESDSQENSSLTNDMNGIVSDDAQGSTNVTVIEGMEQYVDETEENQDNENVNESHEEADKAAEKALDDFINADSPQAPQNLLVNEVTSSGEVGGSEVGGSEVGGNEVGGNELEGNGVGNTNNEEDGADEENSESEEEEVELMAGIAPSHEQEVNDVPLSPALKRKQRVDEILEGEIDFEDEQMVDADQELEQESESASAPVPEGLCVECRDQEASFFCEQCSEDFCEMCFAMIHRTGNRRNHAFKNLSLNTKMNGKAKTDAVTNTSNGDMDTEEPAHEEDEQMEELKSVNIISSGKTSFGDWLEGRAKYIPIRLTMDERKLLRLLEAALNVSEYTDKIDIISFSSSKARRIVHQIKDLCAILSGLMVASDYKKGQDLISNKSFEDNQEFFQKIFEIGRRHKIMNPEKMRDAYGKLIYMLMDSVLPDVQEMLSLKLIIPIKTVYSFLKERNGLDMLHHPYAMEATKEIIADGKSRAQINSEIRNKERAIEILSHKFQNNNLNKEEIKQCIYSIGDNHAYLRANRDCCDRMLHYLQLYFNPKKIENGYSLAIISGRNGARLSHSHEMQYYYAQQTLQLWREIQHEMFMLWSLADQDLLSEYNSYRLRDTGQGLNRMQNCPAVSKSMHSILHRAQQKVGYWVGSSVIHLGDKNVPNALMFIDKYNQVSRILNPILICVDNIASVIENNTGLRNYVENSFGGFEALKKSILADFFRYAFDGSGADNFFDAGSCIDGRLTSAWNWCSLIEKKTYFPVFLLTGFVGFDGDGF